MLAGMKLIKESIFSILVEAGLFDDYGDATEALIPHYLSAEEKQKLMDRYDKMGIPYVVQSDPMDQPDPNDIMNPPRSRRQIVRDVIGTADRLEYDLQRRSDTQDIERSKVASQRDFSPTDKTMPLSRISNMAKADSTFPTGVLSDFEEYSNPRGQDAQLARMSDFEAGEETTEPLDDSPLDFEFNFDKFNREDEEDTVLINSESDDNLRREIRESRGSLIRKKYFGRY